MLGLTILFQAGLRLQGGLYKRCEFTNPGVIRCVLFESKDVRGGPCRD